MTQLDLFAPSLITHLRAIAAERMAQAQARAAEVRRAVLAKLAGGMLGERVYQGLGKRRDQ